MAIFKNGKKLKLGIMYLEAILQFYQFNCDNVVIGAGSVVIKDITVSGKYAGNPAKKI